MITRPEAQRFGVQYYYKTPSVTLYSLNAVDSVDQRSHFSNAGMSSIQGLSRLKHDDIQLLQSSLSQLTEGGEIAAPAYCA